MPEVPEPVKIILGSAALAFMALGWFSRRHPEIAWLRPFDVSRHLTAEQKKRFRRTHEVTSGMYFILLGLALPLGYIALTAMFFSDFETGEIAAVAAGSLLCIGIGSYAVTRGLKG